MALLILAGVISFRMPAQLRVPIVTTALPLGILIGLSLYIRFGREAVHYDDKGFSLIKGKKTLETHEWSQFEQVSLYADPGTGIQVRLYFQPDGKYVDIPATKTGVDPYMLRNSLLPRLSKQ
jgi:hypothetical protein